MSADEIRPGEEFPIKACAWPRRLKQGPVRQIARDELTGWIVHEDDRLLVIGKPGDVVCHPSKDGPWSSLVGAAREYTGLPTMHLIFRLDRETSGIVVLAKDARMASRLQKAMQERRVAKRYLVILTGDLREPVTVDQPLGDDTASPVYIKTTVRPDGRAARTRFEPVGWGGGFTLARVHLETGRKHQIRAHAHWFGYPVVGDKIYGPDARLYLDFIDSGWTPALEEKLLLPRQALHCAEIDLREAGLEFVFEAPLPDDLRAFCTERGLPVSIGSAPALPGNAKLQLGSSKKVPRSSAPGVSGPASPTLSAPKKFPDGLRMR
jgi:23S rRNA pseudouridine1911/1915/1917 synthase